MAKATATCTCRICGEKFERTKVCQNRKDTDNWEAWAETHFDLCPTHYKEEARKQEQDEGLVCDIRINAALTREHGEVWCTIIAAGDSYNHKDELKAAGYTFGDDVPQAGTFADLIGFSRPIKAWHKHFKADEDEIETIISEFEALGGTGRNLPTDVDIVLAREIAADTAKRKAKTDAAVAEVEATRPIKPDCYPVGRWNGKVYGKAGGHNIYVDGQRQNISDEDAMALIAYAEARVEYNDRLKQAQNQE